MVQETPAPADGANALSVPVARRKVRRKTREEAKRGLAEPSWIHQEEEVIIAEVEAEHAEAELVRKNFFGEGGLDSQQWGIVSIQRVQNQPLREAYCIEKQLMLRERGDEQLNEQLLLHGNLAPESGGTRSSDPQSIIEDRDGFMVEKGAERAFYGQGCYFAELAQYAHHYSYGAQGSHQLLFVDVLCGIVYEMGEELDRAGTKCNRAWLRSNGASVSNGLRLAGYDSVCGGPHQPNQKGPGANHSRLHVVYRANQTYPRFLVTLSEVMRTYKSIVPRALLSARAPCRKRTSTSGRTSLAPPKAPSMRFTPADVKVSHHEQILAVAWLEDQLCLATVSAVLWDCSAGIRLELPHAAQRAAWSASGQLALAQKNRRPPETFRRAESKEKLHEYTHSSPVLSMAFAPCLLSTNSGTPERSLAPISTGKGGHRRAWQLAHSAGTAVEIGAEERAIAHEERVCSLTFHPDPGVPIVAAGAVNGKIRLVNTTGGAETVARGEEVATSATWNAAGDALAVGCEGGTLRILFFKSEEKAKREVIKKEREVGQGCEAKLRWSDELLSREHLQVMI
ncbi:Protein mono-ADP-ribosyltransferase TIPARP (ADP-ribosyltransferase diphtheria toxin-like 14) (ARTD14) (TCDD-inducible poly [ADP-ribose] polymerase) [Durusdinium trenchii]|uniref:Protein mono-ADP-ribosyltransferase TIPARP (ADP-ribosyltransferase diphtheria toxin-like 14) (ARTD14) (TCDD-inducible poly [ADP-ribose] polymerase) n=1 Tax=Durusdinium trenchii TaxID=1381693 RepID=A0ABP0N682_9DINO